MLKCCYVLLISTIYTYQAQPLDANCGVQSTASMPDYCVLKCMQILHDSKCCSICEIDTDFWVDVMTAEHKRLEKIRMELCLACENATHSQKSYGNTMTHLFEAMDSSWCIDALNLNEIVNTNPVSNCSKADINEFHRKKRAFYRRFPGSDESYSITSNDTNLLMGTIFVVVFLILVLLWLCCAMSKFFDPPVSSSGYDINS